MFLGKVSPELAAPGHAPGRFLHYYQGRWCTWQLGATARYCQGQCSTLQPVSSNDVTDAAHATLAVKSAQGHLCTSSGLIAAKTFPTLRTSNHSTTAAAQPHLTKSLLKPCPAYIVTPYPRAVPRSPPRVRSSQPYVLPLDASASKENTALLPTEYPDLPATRWRPAHSECIPRVFELPGNQTPARPLTHSGGFACIRYSFALKRLAVSASSCLNNHLKFTSLPCTAQCCLQTAPPAIQQHSRHCGAH